jgi:hypothetical protein
MYIKPTLYACFEHWGSRVEIASSVFTHETTLRIDIPIVINQILL